MSKRRDRFANMARVKYAELESTSDDTTNASKMIKRVVKNKRLNSGLNAIKPFDRAIKDIESKFGVSYSSLFEFIRWLLLYNSLPVFLLVVTFIIVPEYVYNVDKYELDTANLTVSNSSCNQSLVSLSKCCSSEYQSYLNLKIDSNAWYDIFLDSIEGTGLLEKHFFFYGSYNNRTSRSIYQTNPEYTYFMGLAFALVTIAGLSISAVSMLFKLRSGFERSIIQQMDTVNSMRLGNQTFCSWDYGITSEYYIKYAFVSNLRSFKSTLEDMKYKEMMNKRIYFRKIAPFLRFFVHVAIIGLFGAAGYGFYKLNELVFEEKQKHLENRYLTLLFNYLPALSIKVINWSFKFLFTYIRVIEQYNNNTTVTLFLIRTGFARTVSLLYLIITFSLNIVLNNNTCASQKNNILNQAVSSIDFSIESKNDIYCWENYVGKELYKLIVVDFVLQFVFLVTESVQTAISYVTKPSFKPVFSLETKFLDLLYVQSIFWLSIYFSPFLCIFAPFYYLIKFYLNKLTLKRLCQLPEDGDSSSKISYSVINVFFMIYLLILVVFGFVFTLLRPSKSCGPWRLHYIDDFSVLGELNHQLDTITPRIFIDIIRFIFSTFFLLIMAQIFICLIWIIYKTAKAYKLMTEELRKILNEEINKKELLARQIKEQKKISSNNVDSSIAF